MLPAYLLKHTYIYIPDLLYQDRSLAEAAKLCDERSCRAGSRTSFAFRPAVGTPGSAATQSLAPCPGGGRRWRLALL